MGSNMIRFRNGLCWWKVTDKAQKIFLTDSIKMYIVYGDETTSLVDSMDVLEEAIAIGLDIALFLGYEPAPNIWTKCKRILNQGHWYVKLSDVIKTI
jgi:hypothetical protein